LNARDQLAKALQEANLSTGTGTLDPIGWITFDLYQEVSAKPLVTGFDVDAVFGQ